MGQLELLAHPMALPVLEHSLRSAPPYLAVPWLGGESLLDLVVRSGGPSPSALERLRELAALLAAAHRVGLVHGDLSFSAVQLDGDAGWRVDLTGTQTRRPPAAEAPHDRTCRVPELHEHGPDVSTDNFALGAITLGVLTGQVPSRKALKAAAESLGAELAAVLGRLLEERPEHRASAAELAQALAGDAGGGPHLAMQDAAPRTRAPEDTFSMVGAMDSLATSDALITPTRAGHTPLPLLRAARRTPRRLGRFELGECLGRGGMGEVYRARDVANGGFVALKVLSVDWERSPAALERFRKEARLLAEARHPRVANLLEVNEDAGLHYMAVELVEGKSLAEILEVKGRLEESAALSIAEQVAEALADAHRRGIVHRDIKPSNILIEHGPSGGEKAAGEDFDPAGRVRVVDFGIARFVEQSESLALTQEGSALGTPLYMSPEQATASAVVGPAADVYALGATLFHMLAGRPPFTGGDAVAIMVEQVRTPAPRLETVRPDASRGVAELVARSLAKDPTARYADAADLLEAIERLKRGEESADVQQVRLPPHDPKHLRVFRFEWELLSSPERLWPFVASTDRLNRAAGMAPAEVAVEAKPGEVPVLRAEQRIMGLRLRFHQYPFDWLEGRRHAVLRQFEDGPLRWYLNEVTLEGRPEGGTRLTHTVTVYAPSWLGKLVARQQIGRQLGRELGRIYPRIDAILQGTGQHPGYGVADPFENAPPLTAAVEARIDSILDELRESGVGARTVEQLGLYVRRAPAQELARVRPLALARRLGVDPEDMVRACLRASREGLFTLLWDLVCPSCRAPSEVLESLRQVHEPARCDACAIDFPLDLGQTVEAVFRIHPAIRPSELRTYCVGSPGYAPHVVAQVRLQPGQRSVLNLALAPGAYRLRCHQLGEVVDFRVELPAQAARLDVHFGRDASGQPPRVLLPGQQVVAVVNESEAPIIARLERRGGAEDAWTAARATAHPLFRSLFPDQVLPETTSVAAGEVTVLFAELADPLALWGRLGDADAGIARTHVERLREALEEAGGAPVKTLGTSLLVAFATPSAAIRAALSVLANTPDDAPVRLGLQRGYALVGTVDGRLDYFGRCVDEAVQLARAGDASSVVLGRELATDAELAEIWRERAERARVVTLAETWGVAVPL